MNRGNKREFLNDSVAGLQVGDYVVCQYRDHCFFKDSNPSTQRPRVLRTVGRVHRLEPEFLTLTLETYSNPQLLGMGLVILRSDIVEISKLESKDSRKDSFLANESELGHGK